MDRKHYRGQNLELFLHDCAELIPTRPFTLFMAVIENHHMLFNAHGHMKIAAVLEELCIKLEKEFGQVYRIADNQIVVIVDGVNEGANKKIQAKVKKIINSYSASSHIHCSVAHVVVADGQENCDETLARLYSAAISANYVREEAVTKKEKSRVFMELANEIYDALNNDRLRLVFQPIIDARSGAISHRECLLRIIDEEGNLTSAGSFIHIAEKMGIIESIDLHVLNMVFNILEKDFDTSLSINISSQTIFSQSWQDAFFKRITPQIAGRLIIEITETALMQDLRKVESFIIKIQSTGCLISLDDFGSGYTSFRQIQDLSLDFVKIDGSLIKNISENHHNKILVSSLLRFLKGLGIKTVAEFVEGGETAKFLIDNGVDYMQGNWFGAAN